jgi:hypothetical protein
MNRSLFSLLALSLLPSLVACSSVIPAPKGQDEGKATGKIEAKARVIGRNGEFLALGQIVSEQGDELEVDWGNGKGKVKRAELAPVVPPSQLKAGQRVIAPASATSRNPMIGTLKTVVSPERVLIQWDLDGTEAEVPSSNVALLIRPLCELTRGCKLGVGKEPGSSAESAAPIAGIKVGSTLGVRYEVKGAEYWAPAEVLEILDDGFKVNVRGHGHVDAKKKDIRLLLPESAIKPGAEVLCGAPPQALVRVYIVQVEGKIAQASYSEGGSPSVRCKIGEEIFQAP